VELGKYLCVGLQNVELKAQMKVPMLVRDPNGRSVLKDKSWNDLWRYKLGSVDFYIASYSVLLCDSNETLSTTTKIF
jgi:hypothetical protein